MKSTGYTKTRGTPALSWLDPSLAFYPPELRNPILEAGSEQKILKLVYDGIERDVEPYSLAYKRRQDGVAQEYFYGFDRTGGRSGNIGIKAFLNPKVERIEITNEKFEPRFSIELSKAGEAPAKGYFQGTSFGRGSRRSTRSRRSPFRSFTSGITYVVECSRCGKRLKRKTRNTALRRHKDPSGYDCRGRRGYLVDQY